MNREELEKLEKEVVADAAALAATRGGTTQTTAQQQETWRSLSEKFAEIQKTKATMDSWRAGTPPPDSLIQ